MTEKLEEGSEKGALAQFYTYSGRERVRKTQMIGSKEMNIPGS